MPLPTLAIGVVNVPAGAKSGYVELAAAAEEARGEAKQLGGNALFLERGRLFVA